jgi:hypothetical protein
MVLHNPAVLLPRTVYAQARFAGLTPPAGGSASIHTLETLPMPNPHHQTRRKEVCLYDLDRLGLILLESSDVFYHNQQPVALVDFLRLMPQKSPIIGLRRPLV